MVERNKVREFVIYTGPMWSGKTTRLTAAVERHRIRRTEVLCFKPEIDGRYADSSIVTHSGSRMDAFRRSITLSPPCAGWVEAVATAACFLASLLAGEAWTGSAGGVSAVRPAATQFLPEKLATETT